MCAGGAQSTATHDPGKEQSGSVRALGSRVVRVESGLARLCVPLFACSLLRPSFAWYRSLFVYTVSCALPCPAPQYAAFYKWLQLQMQASAVVHFGMHGTVEWLPGSPLGNTGLSWSDALLGNMPNM